MRVLQQNICGASEPALKLLREFLRRHRRQGFDVICLQETRTTAQRLRVDGYDTVLAERTTAGGGVAILVGPRFAHRSMRKHKAGDEDEMLQLTLHLKESTDAVTPITFTNVYVGSRTVTEDKLEQWIGPIAETDMPSVLLGDFNAHHHDWDRSSEPDSSGKRLQEWTAKHGYIIANDGQATRKGNVALNQQNTAPDVTAATGGVTIYDWQVWHDPSTSDHLYITCTVMWGEAEADYTEEPSYPRQTMYA
jgi:endonuclease/exonuclease/phosphatase family metal-dependent hydrolase